jgi:alpha-glucosidase
MLFTSLIFALLQAQRPLIVAAQSTTSSRPQFTVPASADVGLPVIPNVDDPLAVNAQTVCPGYLASNVKQDDNGFSASLSLAGEPCNVYGTDIDELSLVVQFQSKNRLEINISPSKIVS